MTGDYAEIVQGSWAAVAADAEQLTEAFLMRLAELCPTCAVALGIPSTGEGRRALVREIAELVSRADEPRRVVAAGAALARRGPRPPTDGELSLIGEVLLWTLRQRLGGAFTPAVHDAWLEAYTLLASIGRRVRASGEIPRLDE